jgi:hypothetical protein
MKEVVDVQQTAGSALRASPIDVAVLRDLPLPFVPWLVALAADALAVATLASFPRTGAAAIVAALLHVAAALSFLITPLGAGTLAPSERMLAAALTLTLPLVGAPVALVALSTVGRSELTQAAPLERRLPPPPDPEEVRRMAEALPCCEALLSGDADLRRAIIATLTRRADADALAMLRWALGAPDPELAVEAALALEEISASFETRLGAGRRGVRESPTFEVVQAAAENITSAVDAGVADPSLIPSLAAEARQLYQQAADLEPTRYAVIAAGRARLELAVLRPDAAVSCIDGALARGPAEARAALLELREEAVLASHVLPWEGPSLLASYRPAAPPPLAARRRTTIEHRERGQRRFTVFPRGDRSGDRDH